MNENDDLIFQVVDWRGGDGYNESNKNCHFIKMYGRTEDGKSVYVRVDGFCPFFYVEVPDNWNNIRKQKLLDCLKYKVQPYFYEGLQKCEMIEKYKFWGFTNYKKFKFLKFTFNDLTSMRKFSNVFENPIVVRDISRTPYLYKLYESNIAPFIRFIHTKNLNTVGWIKIPKGTFKNFGATEVSTCCDINVKTNWKNVERVENDKILPLVIASFDIECTSCDGSFPQATRETDKIIQIGTVFSRVGEKECYHKNIMVLGTCGKVEGTEVVSCQTEQELLIKWSDMIRRTNPDIIVGYNINGFDFKYLHDRAIELDIYPQFSRLSRNTNEITNFEAKELVSSGLGQNKLLYYDTTGRVVIDLYKVVQRDYKLPSYKLDAVSSNFIKEKIKDIKFDKATNTTSIGTGNMYGLRIGQFVKINYNDGITENPHMDGHKFEVSDMKTEKVTTVDKDGKEKVEEKGIIIVNGFVDPEIMKTGFTVSWAHAKDDIEPKEIFKCQEGTAKDRAKIAKYCVQDCELCVKLMEKLVVVVNNSAMANVCIVPLSYLFYRGQGVKIFSLVAKTCNKSDHLVPVIKKDEKKDVDVKDAEKFEKHIDLMIRKDIGKDDNEDDEDTDSWYEGATVFDPVIGVHYDPIGVLDFSSLYPKSMIFGNLSHECNVLDPKYKNIPGYTYKEITYKTRTGTKTCIFAKRDDGKMGILPEILTELLKKRSETRKKGEAEKDPFLKIVYDGLQLAYKVTANSLYGQTGAPTSPIYMKDIAACTTRIGRTMLEFSRDFVEKTYPKLVMKALGSDYEDFVVLCKEVFAKTPQKKFTNEKAGFKTEDEFYKMFYDKMRTLLAGKTIAPKVIYGDTDSVFINYNIFDVATQKACKDRNALEIAIRLGMMASTTICLLLPEPEEQAYEKTMWPLILITKKKYVGDLYEDKSDKPKARKSMGIVLKRRDNAPIVKIVVGNIVEQIIKHRSSAGAIEQTQKIIHDILCEKYPIERFVITKTLRDDYKKGSCELLSDYLCEKYPKDAQQINHILIDTFQKERRERTIYNLLLKYPNEKQMIRKYLFEEYKTGSRERLVHVVLAKRMAIRDPGNKPQVNDRIPYVYIVKKLKKGDLQGEKVELPDYVIQNKLRIDYLFYITNQIMKPAIQFLELIAENSQKIFDDFIQREINRRKGSKPIYYYLKPQEQEEDEEHNVEKELEMDFSEQESEVESVKTKHNRVIKKSTKKSTSKTTTKIKPPSLDNVEWFD